MDNAKGTQVATVTTARHVQLAAAERLLVRAGMQCHLFGDHDSATRIELLAMYAADEAEYQHGLARGHCVPAPRSGPAGCTIGWFYAFDPHTKRVRELRGLDRAARRAT